MAYLDLATCADHGILTVLNILRGMSVATKRIVTACPPQVPVCTLTAPAHARTLEAGADAPIDPALYAGCAQFIPMSEDVNTRIAQLTSRFEVKTDDVIMFDPRAPFGIRAYFPGSLGLIRYDVGAGIWVEAAYGVGGITGTAAITKARTLKNLITVRSRAVTARVYLAGEAVLILWRGLWWEVTDDTGHMELVNVPIGAKMSLLGEMTLRSVKEQTDYEAAHPLAQAAVGEGIVTQAAPADDPWGDVAEDGDDEEDEEVDEDGN